MKIERLYHTNINGESVDAPYCTLRIIIRTPRAFKLQTDEDFSSICKECKGAIPTQLSFPPYGV